MRVSRISVKKLFGVFDHEIPLSNSRSVTIIHAPNGFGKTVMLEMVAALGGGETDIFERIPFEEFRIDFDNGTAWTVSRGTSEIGMPPSLEYFRIDERGTAEKADVPGLPDELLDEIDSRVPAPYRRFGSGWVDQDDGIEYTLDEITDMFPPAAALAKQLLRAYPKSRFGGLEVFVIRANRLEAIKPSQTGPRVALNRTSTRTVDTRPPAARVQEYSRDVVVQIKSALADYAKYSQEKDRTFPERLVRFVPDHLTVLPEKDILAKMQDLEKKRQRLISLGFLDSETGLRDLTEEDVRRAQEALTIYVRDTDEKLRVFDELAERVGKLRDIINERFQYKRLTIERNLGFKVVANSGDVVSLDDLSSGEQHELVLLYELLFRTPKNGLVLVDEPEISLHVAWQSRFLSDLLDILGASGAYAIVATHSPTIIGSMWELAVELEGPPN
jgi:predicted ATP-binding protein involved in virulence